ncbi:MAG TPA: hypothetical protein VKB19_19745 [Pedobacter sp.]|nr:hypothetical protein [Pedobacter sp.]
MKRLFFGLAVAIVALSASAFTNATPASKTLTLYWYSTNTTGNTLTNPDQVSAAASPTSEPCPGTTGNYCARGFSAGETIIDGAFRRPNIAVSSGAPARILP